MSQSVIVDLNISPDEFLKLYEGIAENVNARARDGRRIRFPARILRSFVAREGVQGSFLIHFDDAMKFQSIDRL